MIYHDTLKENWQAIHMKKAKDTLKSASRENRTSFDHIYKVGDYAFVSDWKL